MLAGAHDVTHYADPRWRLSNLYRIQDAAGRPIPFRPNPVQLALLDDLWFLNVVLKSRQHGMTTLIDLMALDHALWNPTQNVGILAHGLREAQEIFRTKVEFPYSQLPAGIRAAIPAETQSKSELQFGNGSRIAVGTSVRSGTYQFLHVSEMGKIARRYPDRAAEIVAGSFQAVHQGQMIFVESTAEGRDGVFFQLCETARKARLSGRKLTALDFRFHFFAWHQDPRNQLSEQDAAEVRLTAEQERYFADLERKHGIATTHRQRAWWAKKEETLGELMNSEHPSTPEEAFAAAVAGAIYGRQMTWLRERGRIGDYPVVPGHPVNTFWDLGRRDHTAIWFHQFVGGRHRFVNFYQNAFQDTAHYHSVLQTWQMQNEVPFLAHYLPHDADTQTLASMNNKDGRSVREQLEKKGLQNIVIVPRIQDLTVGHDLTRERFPLVEIDETACAEGVSCLDNYQYEWDDRLGAYRPTPLENSAIHGADAFRMWAQGWTAGGPGQSFERRRPRGHMTV